ncbi:MAG: asparagine synthase (glutamine-hydrolyzing) [Nitrospiraceae bacterium]|nr:MAG: asparagine synthase (glutamine-hydrolyzing) [Nitrospiraceae bacterium]
MCGICGKVYIDGERKVSGNEITGMRDVMIRRGPDDAGLFIKNNVGLGHRRLSIIDLEASHQPMSNEDGSIWIVFNGEIYSFKELRDELLKKGHVFKTKGDTEVIIHLYEEYGRDCVSMLRGMFAFAVWDSRDDSLFLARDRIGKKPLHYYHDNKVFLFGSEIKSILADEYYNSKKEMDMHALHSYFSFLCVPDPLTMFKGIRKLPAGHTLTLKRGRADINKYWDVNFGGTQVKTEKQYCEELMELLKEAVRIRLISDVPLGAFLSGGIDSSSVVALMSQLVDQPVKTFSIGFSEDRYNESSDARIVAEYFKTDHTEFILNPKDIITGINEILLYFDEPFADSSALPTYYVSKLAREKVTVILSGDGGDELFGGYPWRADRPGYQLALSRLPMFLKKNLRFAARFLPSAVKGKNFLRHIDMPYERYILDAKAVFNQEERSSLYSDELINALKGIDPYHYNLQYLKKADDKGWTDSIMEYDLKTYLPNDILTKVDRMSMFNSLEVRVPILDHRVIEYAAVIPASLKIKNGISKYIFKKAMKDILPKQVLGKIKHGFNLPLETWLRTDLKKDVREIILNAGRHSYFNNANIEAMLKKFFGGDDSYNFKVWELYVFQLWYQKIFRGDDNERS